jgi:hypothetical protein
MGKMPVEEVATLLGVSHRVVLGDSKSENQEVSWLKDGVEIAGGYFGRKTQRVVISAIGEFDETLFEDDDADRLLYCFATSERHSDNE